MKTIRNGMFETNSSSVHTITMCSGSDYDKWEKGELVYDRWREELVNPSSVDPSLFHENDDDDDGYFKSPDDFFEYIEQCAFETYTKKFTTEKGEKIVAFGYYGHD